MKETYNNEGIECPHCGYIETDEETIHNDEENWIYECGNCGKILDVQKNILFSWEAIERAREVILDDIERETKNGERLMEAHPQLKENPYIHKIKELEKELEEL